MIRRPSRSARLPVYRILLVVFALFVPSFLRGGILSPTPARAENLGPGGGTRILAGDQVIGPYRIYATVSPEPAYAGTLTFDVRISDPATGEKVLDADVTVALTHEDGTVLTGRATHQDAGSPVDYAAHIPVEKAGTYDGVIRISGPAGQAEVPFTEPVLAKRRFSGIILAGLPFLVVLALLGGFWFARSGKK
jgi:hypothetical protein